MKKVTLISLLGSMALVGCSGSSEPSAAEGGAAQSGFTRSMSDAEKAKLGGPASATSAAPAGADPAAKKGMP